MNKSPWFFFTYISLKEKVFILTGLIMLIAYDFFEQCNNSISNGIYNYTSGIFLLLSFAYVLLTALNYYNVELKRAPKQVDTDKEGNKSNEGDEKSSQSTTEDLPTIKFDNIKVSKLFPIIKYLTYLFLITNFCSIIYYFYDTLYYQPHHVKITNNDVNKIKTLLSYQAITSVALLDSINDRFPNQVFFTAGKITSLKLDTGTLFCYYFKVNQTKKIYTIPSIRIWFSNFTRCDINKFCTCDTVNGCLKDKNIELFYLVVPRINKKVHTTDTFFYSRIK